MTTLEAVSTYLPRTSVAVADVLRDLGHAERAVPYERYFGFSRVRADPAEQLAQQLGSAVAGLGLTDAARREVRYVVHAPTIAFAGTYARSAPAAVAEQEGLERATCFTVSQHACASPFIAVDVVAGLLRDEEVRASLPPGTLRGLVLAGEKTFTDEARHIVDSAVMGEGTAAVLVGTGSDGPGPHGGDVVVGYRSRTWGEFHGAPYLDPEGQARFEAMYVDGLCEVVRRTVESAGLRPTDVTVLPHKVNRLSWLRVQRRLGLPSGRIILEGQSDTGHCFGADPFLGLHAAVAADRLAPGDHYLLVAAGLGATMAAMLVRRGDARVTG